MFCAFLSLSIKSSLDKYLNLYLKSLVSFFLALSLLILISIDMILKNSNLEIAIYICYFHYYWLQRHSNGANVKYQKRVFIEPGLHVGRLQEIKISSQV